MGRKFGVGSAFIFALLSAAAIGAATLPGAARAQTPVFFGSSDDPREHEQRFWWERDQVLDVMGGFSLIGAQWRTATGFALNVATRPFTARFSGALRAGIYGTYRPDIDEAYDALRLVEYVRLPLQPRSRFYLRAGPIERMRLGTGHVVDFFNSRVAWDERTVGVETMWRTRPLEAAVFTDNVLLDGVTGARVALSPLFFARNYRARSLQLGFNYTTDLAPRPPGVPRLTAYNLDARFDAFRSGALTLSPFVSVAWFDGFGNGLFFGADLHSENFIDLARFRFRLALQYNSKRFIPSYFDAFYTVNNLHARILRTEDVGDAAGETFAGVALGDADGGNDIVTELRLYLFSGFEFWYAFRRHYGSQALSTYHLRLYLRARRFSLYIGQDRGGLRSFFSLLNDLGDQSALVFRTDYRFFRHFRIYVRARYTYERIGDGADGTERYLVQRRFEPLTGIRMTF